MQHDFKELPQRKVIDQNTLIDNESLTIYRLCHYHQDSDDELLFHCGSQDINLSELCAYIQFKAETEIDIAFELGFQHVLEFLYLTLGALQVINVSSNNCEYIK